MVLQVAVLLPFRAFRSSPLYHYIPGEEMPPVRRGVEFRQDAAPALFVYRQRFRFPGDNEESVREGVTGVLDRGAVVLPHEETSADRVADCARMLASAESDPGSLWLWCDDSNALVSPLLEMTGEAEIQVTDRFRCLHQMWTVTDAGRISDIQRALEGRTFFLADGHHRFAAGWNLATIQIRSHALRTLPSHRLVIAASDMSLPEAVPVHDIAGYLSSPAAGHHRCVIVTRGPVFKGIEVALGVQVERLLPGATVHPIREMAQAVEAVLSGQAQMALLCAPLLLEQIEGDARRGLLLPPRSTDFYPKLAAGLVSYRPQKENVTPPVAHRPGVLNPSS